MPTVLSSMVKRIANYIELALAALICVAVLVATVRVILFESPYLLQGNLEIDYFLERALSFAIGIELVKLLCEHTSETMIEVLMFAISREMIIVRMEPTNTLVCIVAIAGLFAIRKYLFVKFEDGDRIVFRGSLRLSTANRLANVKIPGDGNKCLRDVLMEVLSEESRTIAIGSFIEFADCALRIDSMDGDKISRVEIIRENS